VSEAFEAIALNPTRYAPLADLPIVRTFRLKQFPFAIHFLVRADFI
jgi:hypothetical protein